MIDITTSKGFTCAIPEEALDDYELLEDLVAAQNGEQLRIMDAARRLLGNDQMKELKEFVRSENGRVKASDIFAAVSEIFAILTEQNKHAKK
jgi:hypothetical protein